MGTRVKVQVNMAVPGSVLARLGLDRRGDVQSFLVGTVNRRITKYIPYRSGALATKLKYIAGPTEIVIQGPYARYQYYGKAMEGSPPRRVTDRDLRYDKTKHPQAGPFWDRRLMAAEGGQITAEVRRYLRRRRR